MKRVVTGAAVVASLFLLTGCGSSTAGKTSNSRSNSSSVTFSGTKKERAAQMDVDSLFKNSKHKTLLSGTTPDNVNTVKIEVLSLKSSSIKKSLLADVKTAEKLAKDAHKESLSSSAKSESIYKKDAPKRKSESIAAAKLSSESQSKADSRLQKKRFFLTFLATNRSLNNFN